MSRFRCPQAPGCPHNDYPELITAFLFIPKKPHTYTTRPSPSSSGKLRQCAGGRVLKGKLGSSPTGFAINLLCAFHVKVQSTGSGADPPGGESQLSTEQLCELGIVTCPLGVSTSLSKNRGSDSIHLTSRGRIKQANPCRALGMLPGTE